MFFWKALIQDISATYRAGRTEFLCSALAKLPGHKSVFFSLCSFFLPLVCIHHERAGSKSWFQRRQWKFTRCPQ